jgi:hypothetical protein
MVDYTDPSEFEDLAHSRLLGHKMIYPSRSGRAKSVMVKWLVRMGMLDPDTLKPTEKGVIYGHDLETTYSEWFHPNRNDYRDELERTFRTGKSISPVLHMRQTGSKPVVFLFHVPDPYITDADQQVMLKLHHDFGSLNLEEFELLVRSISDDDNYPTDFWLVAKGEYSLLGRGMPQLLKRVGKHGRFLYVFANIEQHATIVEGRRVDGQLRVALNVYFSCSERIPYADSIAQLRSKIQPILTVLGQEQKFEEAVASAAEIRVNTGEEWESHRVPEDGPNLATFQITPTALLKRTFNRRSRKIIALVVTKPPPVSKRIPWLGGVSPWLVYCGGGTLDSDLEKGARFMFHRLVILELDEAVLCEAMISRVHRVRRSSSGLLDDLVGQAI